MSETNEEFAQEMLRHFMMWSRSCIINALVANEALAEKIDAGGPVCLTDRVADEIAIIARRVQGNRARPAHLKDVPAECVVCDLSDSAQNRAWVCATLRRCLEITEEVVE